MIHTVYLREIEFTELKYLLFRLIINNKKKSLLNKL